MSDISRPDLVVDIIAVILGIAYPIIIETIARLDEKFSTSDIVTYFKKEPEYYLYKYLLFTDLIVLGFFLTSELSYFSLSRTFLQVMNLILIVNTAALVFSFLLLISKLLKYYSKEELVKYLIKLDKKAQIKGDYRYFNTITDIFCWSIRNDIDKIPETLNEYFYSCFRNYEQKK